MIEPFNKSLHWPLGLSLKLGKLMTNWIASDKSLLFRLRTLPDTQF